MSDNEKIRVSGDSPRTAESSTLPTVNPAIEKPDPPRAGLHPAVYVIVWITLSSSVILFNKYLLDTMGFRFPIVLTTWHLAFASFLTQVLARTTTLLDGRKTVKMTPRVYIRAIVPIGFLFSLSLMCGNKAYLYLSVAFIQMLKATVIVAVLFATWGFGVAEPNLKTLGNVSIIVVGIIIASYGEVQFNLIGFMYQAGGIVFEAIRLVMVQRLLSSAEYKMDPLVSLYYFAPVCALMNGLTALATEVPTMTMDDIYHVGFPILLANAMIAFMLNVSAVFLIGKTSSLVLTLCGVLKDILLVGASMLIWSTPVTPLQFFGYSVALSGLVYYKLGPDQIKQYVGQAGLVWSEFGVQRPALRKFLVFFAILSTLFLVIGSLTPTFAPETAANLGGILNEGTTGA
ncbi:MAG: hypothetical protein M1834_007616 [Cirrosporium novae-zelandiae]|nr:MAG: hypothetical protein M1834_007616 [Cirrosporium novae-zelandiae]